METQKEILIKIRNLGKEFPIKKGFFNKKVGSVHAVNDVSLDIFKGETLSIVGESGCGKSTLGRCITNLTDITSGKIKFHDKDILYSNKKELHQKIQIIFQNPYSSLNPRMTIKDILEEPLVINNYSKSEIKKRLSKTLSLVNLEEGILSRFPHEFSGGQRQRIGIARALILEPEFIVADEPVSALDVSVQAQILNLLNELKKELNLTYIFISHDLSVVKYVSDRIAVMYLGEIVELANNNELYETPKHPYTQALLSSIPIPDPTKSNKERIILKGDIPSPSNPPKGCKFNTRCPFVMDICYKEHPELKEIEPNRNVRCFLYEDKK